MKNYITNYSVSLHPYNRNEDAKKTHSIIWKEKNASIEDFKNDILNDMAFCACFNHDSNTFTNKEKSENNFKLSSFIIFDFDAVKLDITEFYNIMTLTEICPNLIYTTANNGKQKKDSEKYFNRYRLIYFLDTPITNVNLYKSIHHEIKKEIFEYVEDDNIFNDNTDISPSHFFAGNKNATIIEGDNVVYSCKWLIDRYSITSTNESINQLYNKGLINKHDKSVNQSYKKGYIYNLVINKINNINNKSINQLYNINKEEEGKESIIRLIDTFSEIENDVFIKDYYKNDFKAILDKYSGGNFVNRMVTPIEPAKGLIIDLPNDYTEIRRYYHFSPVTGYTIPKIKNGEGRRKKLYQNLLLRKRITPNITLQNLLYNAIYEIINFIDNTDKNDIITKRQIAQIVVNAFFDDCTIKDYKKPKYKINKEYCKMNGIKAQQANIKYINERRTKEKNKRSNEISKHFDVQKSDKENLQILIDKGINISMATLKRWKKENGIMKYKKTQHHANIYDLSVYNIEADKLPTSIEINEHGANKRLNIENNCIGDNMQIDNECNYIKEDSNFMMVANNFDLSVYNVEGDKLPTSREKNEHVANKHEITYILDALMKIHDSILNRSYKMMIWQIMELIKEMNRRNEEMKYYDHFKNSLIEYAKDNTDNNHEREKYINGIEKYFIPTPINKS